MADASKERFNRFEVLGVSNDEFEDGEHIDGVELIQEVVEVTVDSGAARSVWPITKKGVVRSKARKSVKLAAANGSAIKVEGEAKLGFVREGKQCSMKFLDADVKRPLAAVSAIVNEGNRVVFEATGSYIENVATGRRIPMHRKNNVFVLQLEASPTPSTAKKPNSGVDAVADEAASVEDEMVFKSRLSESAMVDFRRRA